MDGTYGLSNILLEEVERNWWEKLSGGVEILYVDAAARDNLKAAAGLGFGH